MARALSALSPVPGHPSPRRTPLAARRAAPRRRCLLAGWLAGWLGWLAGSAVRASERASEREPETSSLGPGTLQLRVVYSQPVSGEFRT